MSAELTSPRSYDWALSSVGSPRVIVECGSREGHDTALLARRFPQAEVHAFECHPRMARVARDFLRPFEAIKLTGAAVWRTTGCHPFHAISYPSRHYLDDVGYSSCFRPLPRLWNLLPAAVLEDTPTVSTIRLDEYCRNASIDSIDLLCMDIQGAEMAALQGLGKYLFAIENIICEVGDERIYERQPVREELERFLFVSGFELAGYRAASEHHGDAWYRRKPRLAARHSGAIGDGIGSIPAARALGVDTYRLSCRQCIPGEYTPQRVEELATLLADQGFQVDIGDGEFQVDLDLFRSHPLVFQHHLSLSHWQILLPGLDFPDQPWLWLEPLPAAAIVVHWKNHRCAAGYALDWALLRNHAVEVIGSPDEYAEFRRQLAIEAPYRPVADFLEFARVIAGSKLYVAVASSGAQIADALQHPRVIQRWIPPPCNADPFGPHAYPELTAEIIERYLAPRPDDG